MDAYNFCTMSVTINDLSIIQLNRTIYCSLTVRLSHNSAFVNCPSGMESLISVPTSATELKVSFSGVEAVLINTKVPME